MQERRSVTLSKKKLAIAMSEDFLKGFAALVPPLFVAGLLYDVKIEKFQAHEKTAIYGLISLAGILKTAIESYKREHPSMAKSYDYPDPVKILDHAFATADGFASFVIPFLFLGIQDDLRSTVQLFHLPILICSGIYALLSLTRSIDRATQLQTNAERQALLSNRRHIVEEGFVPDCRCLMDYLNNAIFPAFFLIAPLAFVLHDFFDTLTLPIMAGLGFAILLTAIARFYVYNYQRNNPGDLPKDFPFWAKIIEILSTTLGDFGLFAIPLLVLNAFFPLPEAAKIVCTATASTYSALAIISKADDLGLSITQNTAAWCCSFFSPGGRSYRNDMSELLDTMGESTFHSSSSSNLPLYQPENAGCWNTVKKATTSCASFFSCSPTAKTESRETLLLGSRHQSINRDGYLTLKQ